MTIEMNWKDWTRARLLRLQLPGESVRLAPLLSSSLLADPHPQGGRVLSRSQDQLTSHLSSLPPSPLPRVTSWLLLSSSHLPSATSTITTPLTIREVIVLPGWRRPPGPHVVTSPILEGNQIYTYIQYTLQGLCSTGPFFARSLANLTLIAWQRLICHFQPFSLLVFFPVSSKNGVFYEKGAATFSCMMINTKWLGCCC